METKDMTREQLIEQVKFLEKQLEDRDEQLSAIVDTEPKIDKEILRYQKWMFDTYPSAGNSYVDDEDAAEAIKWYISNWRQSETLKSERNDK